MPQLTTRQRRRILQWVRMLESGEFRQAKNRLKYRPVGQKPQHCCLGVACELYMVERGGFWMNDHDDGEHFVADFPEDNRPWWEDDDDILVIADADEMTLPKAVQEWFGITTPIQDGLSTMNDAGRSFLEIAAAIRLWLKTGKVPEMPLAEIL